MDERETDIETETEPERRSDAESNSNSSSSSNSDAGADAESPSSADDELERIRAAKREAVRERLEHERRRAASPDRPIAIEGPTHFRETLESNPVVLVDFYADWCGPCQMLAPTLETIAADTDAAVAKVDTEARPGLAQQFGVRGLPTLLLFVDGEPVEQLVGLQDETTLRELVESASSASSAESAT